MEVKELKDVCKEEKSVIAQLAENDHEQVLFCQDKTVGLKAIIAIHNTVLGPALGGTRMWQYDNEADALQDVLRLSRGMSYKASISGLNLGGGKAVIIGDSRKHKSEALFRRFGKFVDSLAGKYITAEDVGISPSDIAYVGMETKHCAGLPGKSGDPSPVTAYGVFMGLKAAAKVQFGTDSLANRTVAVQGVGHVGAYLVEYLTKEGAKVVVTDIHQESVKHVCDKFNVTSVAPEDIYDVDMDIFAPCALGAVINDDTLAKLNCGVIAGAANNQLKNEEIHGQAVREKGIIYAPDFLINAGGLINCYSEIHGINDKQTMATTENIYQTTLQIINEAEAQNIPTYLAANKIAEKRIELIGKVKQYY